MAKRTAALWAATLCMAVAAFGSTNSAASAGDTGLASFYGRNHVGKRMASGKIFDMRALTAAHRTLPFGTRLRVTNLANGRSVVVEVADRGPASRRRILDLSYTAAAELGFVRKGVTTVQLEVEPAN